MHDLSAGCWEILLGDHTCEDDPCDRAFGERSILAVMPNSFGFAQLEKTEKKRINSDSDW
jgi:hypothetical protein